MNKFTKIAIAVSSLAFGNIAAASNMYMNLTDNSYDVGGGSFLDANTQTGLFNEFGFNQILATSLYDLTDGTILGSFYDTNVPAELTAAGVPSSGLAMDGTTTVNLVLPNCAGGQCDLDGLSPLVPPLNSDNEGFLNTWDLQVLYHFDGTLSATGPSFTGGYFDIYFNDLVDDTKDRKVLRASVTGSTISAANLDIFFDITFAEKNFLFIDNGSGSFIDAWLGTQPGNDFATMHLDTNVNPPIPEANQLLVVGDNAIRQTTLDGSITSAIPEPSTVALLGLGMLGFGARQRAKKA